MMKISLAVLLFILTILPVFVIMMGIAIWTDAKAKEIDQVITHNRNIYEKEL